MREEPVEAARAEGVIRDWPKHSADVATMMIERYAQPDEVAASMLVWLNKGPWKRSIVYRDAVHHWFPKPHPDMLEQFIDYRVPPQRFNDLVRYGSVIPSGPRGRSRPAATRRR